MSEAWPFHLPALIWGKSLNFSASVSLLVNRRGGLRDAGNTYKVLATVASAQETVCKQVATITVQNPQ